MTRPLTHTEKLSQLAALLDEAQETLNSPAATGTHYGLALILRSLGVLDQLPNREASVKAGRRFLKQQERMTK